MPDCEPSSRRAPRPSWGSNPAYSRFSPPADAARHMHQDRNKTNALTATIPTGLAKKHLAAPNKTKANPRTMLRPIAARPTFLVMAFLPGWTLPYTIPLPTCAQLTYCVGPKKIRCGTDGHPWAKA